MTLRILVDMNMSPDWVPLLADDGHWLRHWSSVGAAGATDQTILEWCHHHEFMILTHDLDFGMMLTLAQHKTPSVLQIRGQDVLPSPIGRLVCAVLKQHESELREGSLVVVDERKLRVRILPIESKHNESQP